MSSGLVTSGQTRLPKALTHAARLLAVCFLVLQISVASVAGKFVGPLPLASALCLNAGAIGTPATDPAPPAPLSHHHDSDCCFLTFGEPTPGVVAILAAYLTPLPAAKLKLSAYLFVPSIIDNPELSPLSPRAPPVARV